MFQMEKTKTLVIEEENTTVTKPAAKPRVQTEKLDVVNFFLQLYKRQVGAPSSAQGEAAALDSETHGPESLFELRVKREDEWHARRMTITPLGEDTGSRSKCFFVIYDVHMVVKVPPVVLDSFQEYTDSIRRDTRIADMLAPRECIVPRVSVILKMIRAFDDAAGLSQAGLEEKYIQWLEEDPRLQAFLKINGSFVYFMDLARYYFLGRIVSKMQDDKDKTAEEIVSHQELIWDTDDFEGRYGVQHSQLCEDLQHLFGKCRAAVGVALVKHKMAGSVQDYQVRRWFLEHLAQRNKVKESDAGGNPALAGDINQAYEKAMGEDPAAVASYREMINDYIREKRFYQNKPQMETIIVNLLELLAWLRQSKVAIRDLKPDNLLVAGNPEHYPHFLTNAGEYNIGLIDVETAADFSRTGAGAMEQPLLGGTPSYATPSHLFANELIALGFDDVGRVLHYQDWQATLGMIFRVATGRPLFSRTGKILPRIPKMFSQAGKDKTAGDLIRESSKVYWQAAMAEFEHKRGGKKAVLASIQVNLDETAALMLQEELAIENDIILQALKKRIITQTIYNSKDAKKKLFAASAKSLNQQKVRLASSPDGNAAQTKVKRRAIKLLGDLERMKNHLARLAWAQKKLARPIPSFTAFEIMGILFDAIVTTMYNPQWEDLTGGDVGSFSPSGKDATYEDASI